MNKKLTKTELEYHKNNRKRKLIFLGLKLLEIGLLIFVLYLCYNIPVWLSIMNYSCKFSEVKIIQNVPNSPHCTDIYDVIFYNFVRILIGGFIAFITLIIMLFILYIIRWWIKTNWKIAGDLV